MSRKNRSKKPDLSDLGDPWSEAGGSDAPDAEDLQSAHDGLRRLVDTLPAGSLSGGERIRDDLDPSTWPEMAEFYGEAASQREGLTQAEKALVFDEGKRQIDTASRKDFERGRKAEKRRAKDDVKAVEQADALWRDFRTTYPEQARDTEAVAAAAAEVSARVQRDHGMDWREYAQTYADDYLDEIASAVYEAGKGRRRAPSEAKGQGQEADGRTQLAPATGTARPAPKADDSPGDMVAEIAEQQRGSGFF